MKLDRFLSASERDHLLTLHRSTRDGAVKDRIKAVLLKDDMWSNRDIARALFINEETVADHVRLYKAEQRLKGAYKGSEPKLSHAQSKELLAHLETNTYLYVKDIAFHVKQTYGIEYTNSGMTSWLKGNDFTYKKPKHTPAKADKEAQEAFIQKYEKLKKHLKEDEVILFGDAVHPQHQSKRAYGWIKKGIKKQLPSTPSQKRANIMGDLNLENMSIIESEIEGSINGAQVIEHLKRIEAAYPDARVIYKFNDNASYFRCKEVQEFLKTSRIVLDFIPAYSPNLNPIERVWKVMHEQIFYNKYYEKFEDFLAVLRNFFKGILPSLLPTLIDRINDNFPIIAFENRIVHFKDVLPTHS